MPKLVLNTRGQFDKQDTWERIQQKYFAQSLDSEPQQTEVHLTVGALKAIVIEAYEHGALKSRSTQKSSLGKLK